MLPDSRHMYTAALSRSVGISDFLILNAQIIARDPLFMPSHLEFIWNAEENQDSKMYGTYLTSALQSCTPIVTDTFKSQNVVSHWTELEYRATGEIMERVLRSAQASWREKTLARLIQYFLRDTRQNQQVIQSPVTARHLVKVATVDPTPLAAEIATANPHWWTVNTKRQQTVSHHQKTWAIALRQLPQPQEQFQPVDGVHESVATNVAEVFPKIHTAVLELADTLGLGLGRVVIVKMQPHSQAYRHFDSEVQLIGRDRYHLVVQSGKKNILESGTERVVASPGDVWFFDNKAMHRAVNESSLPRIHVIFDGKRFTHQELI